MTKIKYIYKEGLIYHFKKTERFYIKDYIYIYMPISRKVLSLILLIFTSSYWKQKGGGWSFMKINVNQTLKSSMLAIE